MRQMTDIQNAQGTLTNNIIIIIIIIIVIIMIIFYTEEGPRWVPHSQV